MGWKHNDDCPLIKYYIVSSPEIKMPIFSQVIVLLAEGLSEEEEKVFAAWERRAIQDSRDKREVNRARW